MYRCVLQTEEGGREDVCTAGSLCVSTRNKHLYNIYIHLLFFLLRSCFDHVCEKTEVGGGRGGGHSAVKPLPLWRRVERKEERDEESVVFRGKEKQPISCRFLNAKIKDSGLDGLLGHDAGGQRPPAQSKVERWPELTSGLRVGGRGHQTECSEGL